MLWETWQVRHAHARAQLCNSADKCHTEHLYKHVTLWTFHIISDTCVYFWPAPALYYQLATSSGEALLGVPQTKCGGTKTTEQSSLIVLCYRYNFMMWCFTFIYFLLIVQQFCSVILNKHYSPACCKLTVLFTRLDLTILNTSYRQVSDTSPEMKPLFRDKIWKTCQMRHHFSECLK